MALEDIAAEIRKGLAGQSFDGSLKFDCGDDGVIVLAGNDATTLDTDADCTLRLSAANLSKLLAGKLNPATAVMMGKIKVSGDISVAMKLSKLIG